MTLKKYYLIFKYLYGIQIANQQSKLVLDMRLVLYIFSIRFTHFCQLARIDYMKHIYFYLYFYIYCIYLLRQ